MATTFIEAGTPGLFTDSARAGFAGFIYTIGWDESGAAIRNWGPGLNGATPRGSWSATPRGLTQSNPLGPGRIFKGDPAEEYEFTAQLTEDGRAARDGGTHLMGMLPVYVDDQNYLQADIDLARWELRVSGRKAGEALSVQTAPLPKRFPVPTGEQTGQLWHYAVETPETNWTAADFNDRDWKSGAGGFGGAGASTVWESNDLWLRREFKLIETPTCMARLRLRLQGDAEVYLNGVLAMRGSGRAAGYEASEIADAARVTLKQGKNILAIHGHKTGDNQAVDAGLFLAGIVETPGSVNLRSVKLNDRVILFVNGQQRLEIGGAWSPSQVGLTSEDLACHFSGLTQFRLH